MHGLQGRYSLTAKDCRGRIGVLVRRLASIDNLRCFECKDFREFEVFALRVVGVFFVFRALVDLAYHLAKVFVTNSIYDAYGTSRPPTPWTLESAAGVIATVIELGLAFWLAIGTRGLVRLLDRARGREQDL